jgi:hypothetical protein
MQMYCTYNMLLPKEIADALCEKTLTFGLVPNVLVGNA